MLLAFIIFAAKFSIKFVLLFAMLISGDISGGTVCTAPPNHLTTRAPPARRCCGAPQAGGDWRIVGIYGPIAIV